MHESVPPPHLQEPTSRYRKQTQVDTGQVNSEIALHILSLKSRIAGLTERRTPGREPWRNLGFIHKQKKESKVHINDMKVEHSESPDHLAREKMIGEYKAMPRGQRRVMVNDAEGPGPTEQNRGLRMVSSGLGSSCML